MAEAVDPATLLDAAQEFSGESSYGVRDELQSLIVRDLLGPWDGEAEAFRPGAMGPRERYLAGMLGPRHQSTSTVTEADAVPDTESGVYGTASGETSAELPEILSPQSLGRMWASSMGMSFRVDRGADVIAVTAEWGQYTKSEIVDDDGNQRSAWAREPVTFEREIRLDGDPDQRVPLTTDDPDVPGVYLAVVVRERDDSRTVELTLINGQHEQRTNGDASWLFQAKLTATALDGASPIFLPVDDAVDAAQNDDDPEEMHLRLLYRNHRKHANGNNVAVHAHVEPGTRTAHKLETTWLPTYDVPATVAPSREGPLADVLLSMEDLADAGPEQLQAGLLPLADGYKTWLDERDTEVDSLPKHLQSTASAAVFRARQADPRIRAGITLLTDTSTPGHEHALRAFRFANRAMAAQRRHTEIGRLREDQAIDFPDALAKVNDMPAEKVVSWRPFQLAFILVNLPALADPAHPDRTSGHDALVDLLFFPTGGGKTEAYLGLTAFTFAIRRLQGTVGAGEDARSGSAGVGVLMRYTLRLLTAQQFQRAAALICAAEVIRREDEATWGLEPFRIGLWVGAGVSPNWFTEAEEQVAEAREAGHGARANVLQTLACPWCGERLTAYRDFEPREQDRRVLLFCPNAEGATACPFSRTQSPEGLPILTVDEEIYRYAPSLVIATVDKLAQLPWKGYAGILFGRTRQWCPRHGFRHDDLDKRTGCRNRHTKPAVTSQPVPRLRPPDLIIQDELHLITGALGTTVGLFETAVDELCGWTLPDGTRTAPKIVASTATTKRSSSQVRGVFGRDLQIFPPQVLDVANTFFSRQVPVTPENPGRRYLGICAHGVRLKSAEIRVAEILLLAGQTLFDTHGAAADPYMSLVGYFSSTRELAGMRRYLDDDIATRVRRHGRAKGLSDRLVSPTRMLAVQELTSRISSGEISEVLRGLEISFDPDIDTSTRRRATIDNLKDVAKANRGKSGRSRDRVEPHGVARAFQDRERSGRSPIDVVLATSMLQVGVDVTRFGLMVVTGQPKNTAEYIQASSRVGRDATRPGLVVTLYNWTRPRDLAHYEDFEHYHATFYRQVEALSVTPFTRRALDRGTAATFVAAVRQMAEDHSRNADAHEVDLDDPQVDALIERLLARADRVDGERGRSYLAERIGQLKDTWNREKSGGARLGYERETTAQQRLVELLHKPGDGPWRDTTVGLSMRETENEINLLVPGGEELFTQQQVFNARPWSFEQPTDTEDDEANGGADEMGDYPAQDEVAAS